MIKSRLIKDTTKDERIEIVESIYTICAFDNEDITTPKALGEASGLSPFARKQYEMYIEGKKEIKEVQKYISGRWNLLKDKLIEHGEEHINIDKFLETGEIELC